MADGPKQSGRKKREGNGKEPEFRFINYNLTTADAGNLEAMQVDVEFPVELMFALVHEGYKVSISLDARNNCCVASITDKRAGSGFFNCCITGRGGTPIDAWVSVAYRHFVVGDDGWEALDNSPDRSTLKYS